MLEIKTDHCITEEFDYRLTFRKHRQQQQQQQQQQHEVQKQPVIPTEELVEEYLRKHAEGYLRHYQNKYFKGQFDILQDSDADDNDDEIADNAKSGACSFGNNNYSYVGFQSGLQKDKILNYLICLRQGLEYSEDIQKKIFYEKVNFMIILMSHDDKWRGRGRRIGSKDTHGDDCKCDPKGNGCRKARFLKQSLERLQKLNSQLQEQRAKIDEKIDQKLEKFRAQKDNYSSWSKLISKRRENEKNKRQKNLLEVSKLFEAEKQERIIKGVNAHRDKLKQMEDEEMERKKLHREKLEEVRQRMMLLKVEREKEKKQKEMAKLEAGRYAAKNDDSNYGNETGKLDNDDVSNHGNDADFNYENDVNDDDENELTASEVSEIEEEEEDNDEAFTFPTVTIENQARIDETVTSDNNLEQPPESKSPKKKKLTKLKLPKVKHKHKKKKTTSKKIPQTDKLPQIKDVKDKLDIALLNQNGQDRRSRESHSPSNTPRKTPVKKKTLISTKSKENVVKEILDSTKELEEKKPKYLEVDLGKNHNVQQIVLETKTIDESDSSKKKSKKKLKKISKSFTLSYSEDGENWFNYNDAIGNALVFKDESNDPLSIHVLDETIVTRHLRVHPTSDKNNFKIRETLLGVECKEDDIKEEKEKEKRTPRKKHAKRPMDTPTNRKLDKKEETPPPPPVLPVLVLEPVLEDEPEEEVDENVSEDDFKNIFQDDLTVHLKDDENYDRSHHNNSNALSAPERGKTMIFSVDDAKSELELAEEKRLANEAEERRQRLKREELLASRQRGIRAKMHQIRRDRLEASKNAETTIKEGKKDTRQSEQHHKADFLSKYCLFTDEQLQWYRAIFDDFQEHEVGSTSGFLSLELTLDALYIINKSLVTDSHYEYILRVLETFDVDATDQVDFKVFSLIAAFSERIKSFRKHFHVLEDDINYSLLIPCLSKAREMYKILLRKNQQYVEIEDFLIELRAAKIDQNILKYILQNEGRSKMDFIDYLTFFPLFVYTHNVIIDNLLYTEKT